MAKQILSGKYFLLTVFFLVFSFFISINSYGGVSMPTDFLDVCDTGQSAFGCCISQNAINSGCHNSFENGAKKVNICHNNGTINPSINSIAGNTPGSHFIRCDWVANGAGQDATNAACDLACVEGVNGAGPGINADCSSFQNVDTGHSTDILGECAPGGCLVNGCDDGNPCTVDFCNENTEECEFDQPESNSTECRPVNGFCDIAEDCDGQATECPPDLLITDSDPDQCSFLNDDCNDGICNGIGPDCVQVDNGECTCSIDGDCEDNNICTDNICDTTTIASCVFPVRSDYATTECRPENAGLFGCDIPENCEENGNCPADVFATDGTICSSDDGDVCTNSECNSVGFCDTSIIPDPPNDFLECLPPGGGDPPGGDEDDILETDNGKAFQLYCYYDLRDRDSFCQVTNVGPDNITLHVQVFNVGNNCIENNFNDTYTPNDTHVYELSNILTNDGSPSGIVLPDDAYGFVVVTVVGGGGQEAVEGDLIGNFRVIDNSGYEYRSNAQGLDFPSDSIQTTNEYTFNFNEEGGVVLSDVVGITLDGITNNEANATSIVNIFTKFDVTVFNNDEVIFSCRDIVFACNNQDAPLLNGLLGVSSSSVASFEYGINNAFPHSRGGPLLCPGNNITEGFVRLDRIPPFSDFDVFTGYVGLNNGNGRGSMDSFWSENFLLIPPPT